MISTEEQSLSEVPRLSIPTRTDQPVFFNEDVNHNLSKIVKTNATILLLGDSGTGKSKLARKIHRLSHLKNEVFIEVQCTTIPDGLLESELFGHEKGAFTGADKAKIGKVEKANGGTLFLDEIGELSLPNQAKLLQLLQDKTISRIGSNQDLKITTRVIIATNKNLPKMVSEGKFRRDLYYRINIFEFKLPRLCDRKLEIKALIQDMIQDFAQRESSSLCFTIPPQLEEVLLKHDWPGNVRELKNVIERLCYLSDDGELKLGDLPDYFLTSRASASMLMPTCDRSPSNKKNLKCVEREYIEHVLKMESNLDNAAKVLGITTVTLWRKRKTYGLI